MPSVFPRQEVSVKEILIYLLLALALIAGVVVAATTPAFAQTPASSTLLLQEK